MPPADMKVSVVTPVFNEAGGILALCQRLESVLGGVIRVTTPQRELRR